MRMLGTRRERASVRWGQGRDQHFAPAKICRSVSALASYIIVSVANTAERHRLADDRSSPGAGVRSRLFLWCPLSHTYSKVQFNFGLVVVVFFPLLLLLFAMASKGNDSGLKKAKLKPSVTWDNLGCYIFLLVVAIYWPALPR